MPQKANILDCLFDSFYNFGTGKIDGKLKTFSIFFIYFEINRGSSLEKSLNFIKDDQKVKTFYFLSSTIIS